MRRCRLVVVTLLGDELIMRAAFDYATVVEADDHIGVADRRESVRDDERGASLHKGIHAALDNRLGARVDGAGSTSSIIITGGSATAARAMASSWR